MLALHSSSPPQLNYCGNENESLSECPNRFKSAASSPTALTEWSPYHPLNASTLHRFSLLSVRIFCHSQGRMRLLAEILIIAALIFYGWNTPFKDHVAQANTTISTKLHGLGSKLQKHQDPSVRRP